MGSPLFVCCILTAGACISLLALLCSIPRYPGDPYDEWEKRKGQHRN